ncbi:hypothetical protein FO519_008735, partial [Halicephalobus sp. NKZ332]
LIIDKFLDSHARSSKEIEIDAEELVDLVIVLEKILWHGFKCKSSTPFSTASEDLWTALKLFTKNNAPLIETFRSVSALENLPTAITRIRAFLRMLLMKKELHDFFGTISTFNLSQFYENWAFMRSECGQVLAPMLLAFKVFDCNLLLDFNVLNDLPTNIDMSKYIKQIRCTNHLEGSSKEEVEQERNFQVVLAQKQFLEDQNKKLIQGLREKEQPEKDHIDEYTRKIEELKKTLKEEEQRNEKTEKLCAILQDENRKLRNTIEKQLTDFSQLISVIKKKVIENDSSTKGTMKHFESEISEIAISHSNKIDSITRKFEIIRQHLIGRSNRSEEEFYDLVAKMEKKQIELQEAQKKKEESLQRVNELEQESQAAHSALQELAELRLIYNQTTQKLQETEQALVDLGPQLSHSKLQIVMMKEQLLPASEWVKDSDVTHCLSCNAEFTVTLRKHHCRRCGQIFCDQCSSNKVNLPSHAKQVRVCLPCFDFLKETVHSTTIIT